MKFDDGRPMKTFEIEKYTHDNDSARGNWLNAAGKSVVRVWQRMVPQQERR
jgi:hypothetical protein